MNEHVTHLDDLAELYALGLLDPDERDRVDAHVLVCDDCAARLGRAEAAMAALADATLAGGASAVRVPRRVSPFAWMSAAAAAFVIATAGLTQQNLALRADVRDDGAMLAAMVHSHFAHAQFVAPGGTPIAAKVVYEQHGRWYRVLAAGADARWRVAVVRGGAGPVVAPQRFSVRGEVAELSLPGGAMRELRLIDPSGAIAGIVRPAPTSP